MARAPSTTAFILVPGAYCPAAYYHKVTAKLAHQGYIVREVDHRSMDSSTQPPASMYDDAANVRAIASALLDEGKDVVMAANSYGGGVITEAAKGLSKAERAAAGKSGGILLNLVYISSLLPALGINTNELIGDIAPVDTKSGKVWLDPPPAEAAWVLMGSLPQDEQLYYGRQLRPQTAQSFDDRITHEGWAHVPVTFVIAENDKAVPTKMSHENVDAVIASGERSIRKVVLNADHCAMVTNPDEVVGVLLEAAGVKL